MIRLRDAVTLAYTKLRMRRIRTGIAVGISGLMFGFLLAGIIMLQGVFESVERFSDGLNSRYTVLTMQSSNSGMDEIYSRLSSPEVVSEVQKVHAERIAEKKTEAKRLNIPYDPEVSDPSPITVDPETKEKSVSLDRLDDWAVKKVLRDRGLLANTLPPIEELVKPYSPKKIYPGGRSVSPVSGQITHMANGKERFEQAKPTHEMPFTINMGENPSLSVIDTEIVDSFIATPISSVSKDEIPVIIPFGQAEKALNLKPLASSAPAQQKKERMREVYRRVNEIRGEFCYRNASSVALLLSAQQINKEIESNKGKKDYVKPILTYTLPSLDSCGPVQVATDTRTAEEKRFMAAQQEFDRKFNGYIDPVQQKIIVRGVGVSPSFNNSFMSDVTAMITAMFSAGIGESWSIPTTALASLPESTAPAAVFASAQAGDVVGIQAQFQNSLVEFSTGEDARAFMRAHDCASCPYTEVSVVPFGSGSLVVSQIKSFTEGAIFWAVVILSAVAALILTGTIGRTVADSRKETAVFRAIGAARSDIVSVYVTYTLMLAGRIIIFALALALAIAFGVQLWIGEEATLGAQLAFSAVNGDKQFGLVGFDSWYIPAILGAILLSSLLAMAVPLLRNVRRSPINDMRDDG